MRLPPEEVREHVHLWLLAPERELPEVVITTRHGRTLVEPGALARRLGGRAQVVLVETGEATYALRDALGDELAVWGGAARVYYPGFTLHDRASQHPRIYAFEGRESEAERGLLAALGVEDAHAEDRYSVGDDVEGDVVSLDSRTATLALSGRLCARARRRPRPRLRALLPRRAADRPARAGRACASSRPTARPGSTCSRSRPTSSRRSPSRPGRGTSCACACGGAATTATRWSCCPGRTPSCRSSTAPPRSRPSATTCWPRASSASTSPTAASSSRSRTRPRARRAPGRCASIPTGPVFLASDDVAAQRSASELDRSEGELNDVRARLEQALADADAVRAERDRLLEELRDERVRARALAADLRSTSEGSTDRDSLLRDEALRDPGAFLAWLGVAYARIHDPAERARYPLRRVVVGAQFLDSMRELQGCSLHKVLDACVHVATGRVSRDPRARAAPAARGSGRDRAAPARRRGARLALRAPGALAFGAAPALLAARGGRRRARPRRHARRGYLVPSRRRRAARGLVRARPARRRACVRARAPRRRASDLRSWPRRAAARPRRRAPRACAARRSAG